MELYGTYEISNGMASSAVLRGGKKYLVIHIVRYFMCNFGVLDSRNLSRIKDRFYVLTFIFEGVAVATDEPA